MPVHDWTQVEAGIFHDFHVAWIAEIRKALNEGLLPSGFYALAEQHAGRAIADVLTLHAGPSPESLESWSPPTAGGTAVAEAPPKVSRRQTAKVPMLSRRRTLAIRHVSGHRLVAMLEILSPANKDRDGTVEEFLDKVIAAVRAGVHLLVVDLFPPGRHDPQGIHGSILDCIDPAHEPYDLPADAPLTLASHAVGRDIEMYVEHLASGAALPEMPLFLHPERYINVPLEPTYMAAYAGMPAFWRDVLEGRSKERH